MGKINEKGTEITYEQFYDSFFFLPFVSHSQVENFDSTMSDRILGSNAVKSSTATLHCEFKKPTTYVIRISLLYRQPRMMAITADRRTYRNVDNDQ